jgi:hypothetical protein
LASASVQFAIEFRGRQAGLDGLAEPRVVGSGRATFSMTLAPGSISQ